MSDASSSWLSHPSLVWALGAFSVIAGVASIVFVPRVLATLPTDYLRGARPEPRPLPLRIAKNVLGCVLALLGLVMLVLPGQGLLTLLVGLLLLDFPGKHRLVVSVLGRHKVLSVVNKLRAHRGAPPLVT